MSKEQLKREGNEMQRQNMELMRRLYPYMTREQLFFRAFQITRCDLSTLKQK